MPEPTQNPNPTPEAPKAAATSFADLLTKTFGEGGIIPQDESKPTQTQPTEGATAAAPAAAVVQATGATGEAPTGATGEAPTGATGEAVSATGETGATGATAATGATGEAPTGATGEALTPEQLEAASKKMDVKAGTAFKFVRNKLETAEKTLSESQSKIAELEAKLAEASKLDPKTLEELQTKVKDYESRIAAVDYQSTPEFQSKIAQPLAASETALKSLATKYQVDEKDLAVALAEKDPAKRSDQLSELSKDFNRIDMATFDRNVVTFDSLQAEKAKVLQFAAETMEQNRRAAEAARAQQVRDFQQSWTQSLDNTLKNLAEKNPLFAKTNDEKWNADLDARVSKIKSIDIARVPNEALATALYKEAAFDLMEGLVADLVNENQGLNERVTKLQGGTPPAGGGNPPPQEPKTPEIKPDALFSDVLKSKLPGILPS